MSQRQNCLLVRFVFLEEVAHWKFHATSAVLQEDGFVSLKQTSVIFNGTEKSKRKTPLLVFKLLLFKIFFFFFLFRLREAFSRFSFGNSSVLIVRLLTFQYFTYSL